VPEGFYHVVEFNPWSTFLLSMKVNYPNRSDVIRGNPMDPGGLIYIHGSCVSIGCISITDPSIEELYVIALDTASRRKTRVLVHIFPARLDEKGMKWLREKHSDSPELIRFWKELKAGFDGFEEDHIPDRFYVKKDGSYAFPWSELEPGIEFAEFDAPIKSSHGNSKFTVIRVDPKRRKLRLLMASEQGGGGLTAPEWAKQHNLAVVVNAGMFENDHKTASFYMKDYDHVNNPKVGKNNSFLAFNPTDDTMPPVQIIDRRCQKFGELRKKYHTIIQGIRMVDCRQRNRWALQNKKWSTAAVAMDKRDHVLFIFTRSPYRMHNLIKMLLGLPLEIYNMMYIEGGPEASLYVSARGKASGMVAGWFGSYETGFNENDDNQKFLPLPNVIGVAKGGPRESAAYMPSEPGVVKSSVPVEIGGQVIPHDT